MDCLTTKTNHRADISKEPNNDKKIFSFDVADTLFKVEHRDHAMPFKYPKHEKSTELANIPSK